MAVPHELLTHVITRLGSRQTENLATSSVIYLLRTYPPTREALVTAIESATHTELGALVFHEQFHTPSGIFDGVGLDADGDVRMFIEAKFGALLDPGQLTGYPTELAKPGVGLYVVPQRRINHLWADLEQAWPPSSPTTGEVRTHAIAGGRVLAMTSWRHLLNVIRSASVADLAFEHEIAELESLIDRLDSSAFRPLAAHDLAHEHGLRALWFDDIVDQVITVAREQEVITALGKFGGGHGYYGVLCCLGGWRIWFGTLADAWATLGETPFWVQFQGGDLTQSGAVQAALGDHLDAQGNARLLMRGSTPVVALRPLLRAPQEAVVADLVAQLAEVRDKVIAYLAANPSAPRSATCP